MVEITTKTRSRCPCSPLRFCLAAFFCILMFGFLNLLSDSSEGMSALKDVEGMLVPENGVVTLIDGTVHSVIDGKIMDGLVDETPPAYTWDRGRRFHVHNHTQIPKPTEAQRDKLFEVACAGPGLDDVKLDQYTEVSGICYPTDNHPSIEDGYLCDDVDYLDETKYSVVVPAYNRVAALKKSIANYGKCEELESYHVVWGNPKTVPDIQELQDLWTDTLSKRSFNTALPHLHVHLMARDTLHNRYEMLPGLETNAVAHIDDDQITPCKDMQQLFNGWRAFPQALAGPHVRAISCPGHPAEGKEKKMGDAGRIHYWGPVEKPIFRSWEMALTKFAMAHRCFSAVYTHGMRRHPNYQEIMDMVDEYLNGEDLLFQAFNSFVTRKPPTFVQYMNINDLGVSDGQGISTRRKNNHYGDREAIIKRIVDLFGFPYVSNSVKFPKNNVDPTRANCPK